jgi:hypothetical protein
MSGKGDARRPAAVPADVVDDNWTRTFAPTGLGAQSTAVSQGDYCLSQTLGYTRCTERCVNIRECPR